MLNALEALIVRFVPHGPDNGLIFGVATEIAILSQPSPAHPAKQLQRNVSESHVPCLLH